MIIRHTILFTVLPQLVLTLHLLQEVLQKVIHLVVAVSHPAAEAEVPSVAEVEAEASDKNKVGFNPTFLILRIIVKIGYNYNSCS